MASDPTAVIKRLQQAVAHHDLDGLVACFDPSYQSEQPAHPNRAFGGYDQVRTNWSAFFEAVPDIQADVLRMAAVEDKVWSEWVWSGHRRDGSALDMRGVIITGIADDRVTWARLYMEETEMMGADIDGTMRHLTRTDEPRTS